MAPEASAASCSTDRAADTATRACGRIRSPRAVARADALLTELLGPLARCGVALHELHPESYGYHGVPQPDLYRRTAEAPSVATPSAEAPSVQPGP